jgi:spore maturation protein CgeB
VNELAAHHAAIRNADLAIIGSFVQDGPEILDVVDRMRRGVLAFYDIDTPVTLHALADGWCAYLRAQDVPRFDLYLSFSGGRALEILAHQYGARAPHALYCSVDPHAHGPVACAKLWDFCYLGT